MNSSDESSPERVRFLDNLCLLSFAGIAFWIFRDIKVFIHYRSMEGYLNSESFIAGILINLMVLAGVILMWKYRKKGFYLYTISQAIWLLLPYFAGSWADTYFGLMSPIAILTTALFIILYTINLKHMF